MFLQMVILKQVKTTEIKLNYFTYFKAMNDFSIN